MRQRRERMARQAPDGAIPTTEFLFEEAAKRLAERLDDVTRSFPTVLELGARHGALARYLSGDRLSGTYVATESSPSLAQRLQYPHRVILADEEQLPVQPGSVDLILANLSLHHVNDLPGTLWQITQTLKPDGLFQAVMLGGDTLQELRACLTAAESEITGGVHPRLSPMADLQQMAGLLQRAGFSLPVADQERITVRYAEPLTLLTELRAMGEANIRTDRCRTPLRRGVLFRALELYRAHYGGDDGRVPASFDLIFLTGWRPDASQPQPLRPGSAATRLATALGVSEQSVDDPVAPLGETR
ncbi:MAG: methyltransferase domain-containing protein, partial [Pseudomonadota bacterium]